MTRVYEMMQPTGSEEQLIRIVRKLPPDRIAQVIDFAQFLEYQATGAVDDAVLEEDTAIEIARWEILLATEESQRLLETMADEAWAEIQAGLATPIVFTNNGEIDPG